VEIIGALKHLPVLLACVTACAAHAADAPLPAAYEWRLPPGFPRPAVPPDNPMSEPKVQLGRRLFHETRLSGTGRYSCASCHRPELAFTDGRPRALGATGESVKHSAMTLANVAYNAAFTWSDSNLHSLEAQMRQPLFNEHPVEMGLANRAQAAVDALTADSAYGQYFAAAFPGDSAPISIDHIVKAIAAFERTLISGRSPFDRYVFDDDPNALSEAQKRGMALFFSARVGCAHCHSGLNFSGPVVYAGHERERATFANNGLYDVDGRGGYPANDQGLIDHTHQAADMGKFRVPTLRNIALTAPYMHDGSLASLEQVIDHYAGGGHKSAQRDPHVRPLVLSPTERADLIDFLQSLTDREFIDDPQFR
jgi:cytochrome c peroxidase